MRMLSGGFLKVIKSGVCAGGTICLLGIGALGQPSYAETQPPSKSLIDEAAVETIKSWLENAVVEISISAQNKKYGAISQSEVDALDKQWRAEREKEDQPLIATTLSSPLSNYLTQIQAGSGGLFTEIFIMDAKGLNVGQSAITSDFWQGDEAKFNKTFPEGHDAIFVDDPEFHDATKTWRTQVNLTVSDANNQPIGAVTVEYNLTELARRRESN